MHDQFWPFNHCLRAIIASQYIGESQLCGTVTRLFVPFFPTKLRNHPQQSGIKNHTENRKKQNNRM